MKVSDAIKSLLISLLSRLIGIGHKPEVFRDIPGERFFFGNSGFHVNRCTSPGLHYDPRPFSRKKQGPDSTTLDIARESEMGFILWDDLTYDAHDKEP